MKSESSEKVHKLQHIAMLMGLAALIVFGASGQARAETDYRCLTDCIHKGKDSHKCMKQCAYDPPPPSVTPSIKPFSTLVPVEKGKIVLSQPKVAKKPEREDYTCLVACQKHGSLHDFCRQQCVIKEKDKPLSPDPN
ncbi:MAG TPA: hypothetical protein VFT64_04610 [Rickettsiales bacterium]|nr:hypothetical protein [Rickettsiales bacterium]